jgi:hypothetical protein
MWTIRPAGAAAIATSIVATARGGAGDPIPVGCHAGCRMRGGSIQPVPPGFGVDMIFQELQASKVYARKPER